MKRKLATAAALLASLAAGGVYLYPAEMKLLMSDPSPHETVFLTSNEIELLFNKPVELFSSVVNVINPDNVNVAQTIYVEDGVLVVRLKAPVVSGYMAGNYSANYQVRSTDGKEAKGSLPFHIGRHHGHDKQ